MLKSGLGIVLSEFTARFLSESTGKALGEFTGEMPRVFKK
jgi:hypothetical protein